MIETALAHAGFFADFIHRGHGITLGLHQAQGGLQHCFLSLRDIHAHNTRPTSRSSKKNPPSKEKGPSSLRFRSVFKKEVRTLTPVRIFPGRLYSTFNKEKEIKESMAAGWDELRKAFRPAGVGVPSTFLNRHCSLGPSHHMVSPRLEREGI